MDGRLLGAPNAKHVAGFDKERMCLPAIAVAEVGAIVMVNLDTKPPTFNEEFEGIETELQAFVPRLAELEFRAWQLRPNCVLPVNPSSNYVVFHYIPDRPERTITKIDWFVGPWLREGEREKIVKDHRKITLEEDRRLVAEVQIGLNNSSYDRGVLMIDAEHPYSGFSEHTVAHLQNLWREVMDTDNGPAESV